MRGMQSIKRLYDGYIRSFVPESRKICVRNGVAVRGFTKMTDMNDHLPDEEGAVAESLRENAAIGDTIVIVGGGYGVTTVIGSREVGREGMVVSYEGSDEMIRRMVETIDMNEAGHNVETVHAVVADFSEHSEASYGNSSATVVPPRDLPECDILQMDCEGAEVQILREMDITPRLLLVETHGFLGSSEQDVRTALNAKEYEVTDRTVEREADGVVQLEARRR
ncbi:FkbM family methyltransferase [Halorubrum sp. AD140]|uniref:FkbM family methyltransferase n=1 Tax=Halorubrum sp. AD140 TaxID=3050073 RepID=UPI002ACC6978|nr:FkbM family methyltransferase [Halorubrum sp. AD140]MDZ5810494.1 FkbM family methyltransferase [Halorubrum sp. AD140]